MVRIIRTDWLTGCDTFTTVACRDTCKHDAASEDLSPPHCTLFCGDCQSDYFAQDEGKTLLFAYQHNQAIEYWPQWLEFLSISSTIHWKIPTIDSHICMIAHVYISRTYVRTHSHENICEQTIHACGKCVLPNNYPSFIVVITSIMLKLWLLPTACSGDDSLLLCSLCAYAICSCTSYWCPVYN